MRKSRDDVSRKRSGNGTRKDNKLVELPSREREPSRGQLVVCTRTRRMFRHETKEEITKTMRPRCGSEVAVHS